MKIIIDSREKKPYLFEFAPPAVEIVKGPLKTGDYSLKGFEDKITIERKSLSDLFGTCGQGRERFERELERMKEFRYAAIVFEASWSTVLQHPPTRSKLKPKTILYSMIAWAQRYNVHCWPCVSRNLAERVTYRILERFIMDKNAN